MKARSASGEYNESIQQRCGRCAMSQATFFVPHAFSESTGTTDGESQEMAVRGSMEAAGVRVSRRREDAMVLPGHEWLVW